MSRLRTKVASLIVDALQRSHPDAVIRLTPDDIEPTTGWYRTSPQADCYRWEAQASIQKGSVNYKITLGSFLTLTVLARAKAVDLYEYRPWWLEVYPADTPDTPQHLAGRRPR